MGLDMYLSKKYYVAKGLFNEGDKEYSLTILRGGKPTDIPSDKINYIETEEIYWRKANAIHRWFVDNVQNGEDNCGTYYVSREQLKELLNTVTKVLESSKLVVGKVKNGASCKDGQWVDDMEDGKFIDNPATAEELLPTAIGFFFGGTDYDQFYYEDLEHTRKELERILSVDDNGEFYYHSSW